MPAMASLVALTGDVPVKDASARSNHEGLLRPLGHLVAHEKPAQEGLVSRLRRQRKVRGHAVSKVVADALVAGDGGQRFEHHQD